MSTIQTVKRNRGEGNAHVFRHEVIGIGLLSIFFTMAAAPPTSAPAELKATPKIQIALLLDTSNSMDGLIDQAKSQLWKIVNEFVTAKRDGQRPEFMVALYEYGNSRLKREEGFIRRVLPLTNDLDKVSEQLFALTTNGGQEYCGQVIEVATKELTWSPSNEDFKVIFIAGNEPFTQGSVDYRKSCKAAISKGIMVNTIFCGREAQGIDTKWKDGAMLADGKFMNIDQNRTIVHIEAPQDAEIARLGVELNATYIPFGRQGEAGAMNQMAQDSNAAKIAQGSALQRAITKSSANYMNANWDLVDAVNNNSAKVEDLQAEDLPEAMRKMSVEERKAYVLKMNENRQQIQQKITELNNQRNRYIADKRKAAAASAPADTFDAAVSRIIQEQASGKGIELK